MTAPDRPPALPPGVTRTGPGSWRLMVWVQPGAKASGVAGVYQDRLKIRVAAPAVDNKANATLQAFVAKRLGLRKSQVRLEAGQASRGKTLVIEADIEPTWASLAPEEHGQ